MKLSKIARLCVRAKRLYLYDDSERGIQWIGDGRSMYPLYMMPELTTETVLRVLDVKDKDFDKIAVSKSDLPSHIDCSDGTDDRLLPEAGISIGYASEVLEPMRLSSGLRFLDPFYLTPVQDKPDLMLYERETAAGEPYIVAKAGLMVQALIQPLSVTDYELLDQLETLARELRQMMQTDETDTDTHRALPWAVDENGEVI